MKTSVLIVMLDFLVCSLLMFVIGTGGKQSQFATSPTSTPRIHEEFAPAAMQAQQEEWNRGYEQQSLLNKLNTTTTENEQLRGRLNETTATLAAREANLKAVSEEKERVEQAKLQTDQALSNVETQLSHVSAEREKLQQEGEAAKESVAKLQTEMTGLQSEQTRLQQEKTQLAQQAQQLGQTVASQQDTISTLSGEVRASQARVEAQLTDVAQGQQAMGTTLAQLDTFAHTLPATIQQSVAGVHDEQQAMQQNVAAMTEDVKNLQSGLNAEEKARLMQAVTDVAKGQQDLQSRLDTLIKDGQNNQVGQSLSAIETGQESLRQQTAKLGDQIESIKAHGPGPYKAVKGARLGLQVLIAKTDPSQGAPTFHFRSTAYPPVVNVGGRSFVVANGRTLGFNWSELDNESEITQLKYTVDRVGDTPWSGPLTGPACALRADPHVVAVEMTQPMPGVSTMELAGPDAVLQTDQHKLYVFKSTAAGLSFEIDTAPDLADARYLVVKRAMRGVAAWFENPAYRPDIGDYVVTSDGKLVGIMVSRERCFILGKDSITDCALSVPINDGPRFLRSVQQFQRLK
jgi:predicted  nucleic acid-binding Zn-ribbon protein